MFVIRVLIGMIDLEAEGEGEVLVVALNIFAEYSCLQALHTEDPGRILTIALYDRAEHLENPGEFIECLLQACLSWRSSDKALKIAKRFLADFAVQNMGGTRKEKIELYKSILKRMFVMKLWEEMDRLMEEEMQTRRMSICALRLQKKWKHVITNPYHDICRRRLLREFAEFQEHA